MASRAAGLLLGLSLLAGASPARGEVSLETIRWQTSTLKRGETRRIYHAIDTLSVAGPAMSGQRAALRADLTFVNRGPHSVEGLLLRYSMSARLAPAQDKEGAVWAVPFMIDQKRVPRVKPNERKTVHLDPTALLRLYLKKVDRWGMKPDRLKIQVMVVPRPGQKAPIRVLESVLSVSP